MKRNLVRLPKVEANPLNCRLNCIGST